MKRKSIFITMIFLILFLAGCGNNTSNDSINNATRSVQNYDITISVILWEEEVVMDGKYTGELVNGKPEGEGEFVASAEDGLSKCTYTGAFSDGFFDGYGIFTAEGNEMNLKLPGTYTKGKYTPTASETFTLIGQLDYYFGEFDFSDSTANYIDSHAELFPASKEEIQGVDAPEFSYKKFKKTGKQDIVEIVKMKSLHALQVFEEDFFDGKLTSILAADDEYNYYAIYYLDTVEIYEGDTFTAFAVPCANSSFDNVSGGTTNVIAMVASYFQ